MVTRGGLDGLEIVLLKVPYAQAFSKRKRMLSYSGFTLGAGLLAASEGPADVVFASSSPLTIGISGVLASRLRRAPFVFELQDLWPAVPIGMGFLTGRAEVGTAEWLERRLYDAARRIVVCSEGVREALVERGIPDRKIVLIPNVSDIEHFRPDIADPSFRGRQAGGGEPRRLAPPARRGEAGRRLRPACGRNGARQRACRAGRKAGPRRRARPKRARAS